MHFPRAAALAACISLTSGQSVRGFNSGSTDLTGAVKTQADFQAEFENQKKLQGTNGVFRNTRLYTMIQGGTTSDPISAIPAAIASNTGLLLGLWASAGQETFNSELAALAATIKQYGSQVAPLIRGISVGSEDLYRETPTGIKSNAGPGADPNTLKNYIGEVRKAIAGTAFSKVPVGHVDTWTAWTNGTNQVAWEACDWVGLDEYPYYQDTDTNPIEDAGTLFYQAYDATKSSTGKPVWITEAGWPVSGPTVGEAVASVKNARSFWEQVYCSLPDSVPVYWFTQEDNNSGDKASFGVAGDTLTPTPLYDLSCKGVVISSSSPSATAASSKTSAGRSTQTTAAASSSVTGGSGSSSASPTSSSGGLGPNYGTTLSSVPPYPSSDASRTSSIMGSGTATGRMATGTAAPTFSPSSTTATASPTPSGDGNGAANTQISTLALLVLPALLALTL